MNLLRFGEDVVERAEATVKLAAKQDLELLDLDAPVHCLNRFDEAEQLLRDELHARLNGRMEYDPHTDCWIYTGAWEANGQAKIRVGGRVHCVSRVAAWVYFAGFELWDVQRVVRVERCLQPACFNPEHLQVAGDQAEALAVQRAFGRLGRAWHRLSPRRAAELRADVLGGMSEAEAAAKYDIRAPSVRAIVRGDTYKAPFALVTK